ncbi:PREDICTED: keratin-associated protein 5-1-like [Acropora digitifera]|uniref:keratin-associated protein 5-1-like n=1 Tax=Acropora digitifera TaxID=70779 RepID=UPI00077A8DD3|nr:PREDICTED: keratin-associated protein 5-1-like [Acropora digitifera]
MSSVLSNAVVVLLIVSFRFSVIFSYCDRSWSSCGSYQVCCKNQCVYGSNCVGESCSLDSQCLVGESCCSSKCRYGSNCLGSYCATKSDCSANEACCSSTCRSGYDCSGQSCTTKSDCSTYQACCSGKCRYGSDCSGQSCSKKSDCSAYEACCSSKCRSRSDCMVNLAPRNLIVQLLKPVVAASVVMVLTVVGILVARAMIAALDRSVAQIPVASMVVMTLPPPLLSL